MHTSLNSTSPGVTHRLRIGTCHKLFLRFLPPLDPMEAFHRHSGAVRMRSVRNKLERTVSQFKEVVRREPRRTPQTAESPQERHNRALAAAREQIDSVYQGLGQCLNVYREAAHPDQNYNVVDRKSAWAGGVAARKHLIGMRDDISDCIELSGDPSTTDMVELAYQNALTSAVVDPDRNFDAALRQLIQAVQHIDIGDQVDPLANATMY
jgi:hypothetical protein